MDARLWMSATVAMSVVSPRSYASVTTSSCSWVSLTFATTALRVSAKFDAGAVGVTPGGAVGCASRKARLRAITSARMAITFEIDVSDIVSLPFQCDVRSEEHTSELQSLMRSSYAVLCLKK